jgi:polysaccharide export outer membrane protein
MQNKNRPVKELSNPAFQEYTLKPYDELFIQINSLDEPQTAITSNSGSQSGGAASAGTPLNTQKVDKEGFLELPIVGKIQVKDKTVDEVTAMLKEAFKNVLNMPMISVKLANSFITVIGEVKVPGHLIYMEDKLNIFDAISMAGDITDYGNRKTVILLRTNNGKTMRTELDLTKPEIVTSDFYYMKPRDIIYVKPLGRKFSALNLKESYSLFITTISAVSMLWIIAKQ